MDLRQFQESSQTQANLGQISAVAPATSNAQFIAGALSQVAPAIAGGIANFQKEEAKTETQTSLGSFTTKLAKAQEAASTDPKFDLAKTQRKIFQETVAANPSLTEDYIKTFKSVTGIDPAGQTEQQKQYTKDLLKAQSLGFGDPTDTPEMQDKQLQLYQDIQREAALMEHEAKKEARDKGNAQREVYKRTSKLVSLKTESLNLMLESDMQALKNGASREEFLAKWAKLQTDWSVEYAQYGEFANDETVKAQVKGITDTFDLANKMLKGDFELEATKRDSEIIIAKQKAQILAEPEAAPLIAASELFRNQPSLTLPINNLIRKLMTKGPSDIREVPAAELEVGKGTVLNMGKSENPKAREEAQTHIFDVASHMWRNGEDYTDEDLLNTCSFLAAPDVYNGMPSDKKNAVVQACSTYAVDVAGKAIRDLETNSSIRIQNEQVTPRGTTVLGEPTVLAAQNFASLDVSEDGFRYTVTPEFQNNRQAQRQVQTMNRQLAKVNPVLQVLSSASGKSMEAVAAESFGLGPQAATEKEPEQPVSLQDRLTSWYEENFTQPSVVATQEEREAKAKQLGQSFLDMFDPVKMGVIKQANASESDFSIPTERPVVPGTPVSNVVNNILGVEGVGDDVTDVPTGIAGVTPAAMKAIGMPNVDPTALSQEEALSVAQAYTQQLEDKFNDGLKGYSTLSPEAQEGILDTAYNLGPGISRYPSFKKAVSKGDEQEALKQLLDTANADGKTLRGIAKRRAHNYNKVADVPIATVEQLEDGTLRYLDTDDNVIFSYKAKGGRHEDSGVGRISVD